MLLESIRLQDGKMPLLSLHQKRMDRARRALYPKGPVIKLQQLVREWELPREGLFKLRLTYTNKVETLDVKPYAVREVRQLRMVNAEHLEYGRKYADREGINRLFERRGDADDIIMVKNGYVMDSSYANLAFFDGKHWYTPSYPMLRGVRRQALLATETIRPSLIRARDLRHFKQVKLINAMLPWGEGPTLPIEAISDGRGRSAAGG